MKYEDINYGLCTSKELLEKLNFENEGYVEKIDSLVYSKKM
ncbi:MAG: hypothetical protein ACRCXT_23980 [Paraclostridium sp.]